MGDMNGVYPGHHGGMMGAPGGPPWPMMPPGPFGQQVRDEVSFIVFVSLCACLFVDIEWLFVWEKFYFSPSTLCFVVGAVIAIELGRHQRAFFFF